MNYDSVENPFIFGKLPAGKVVEISLVMFPGNTLLTLTPGDEVCAETAVPGYYFWDFNLLDRTQLPALTPGNPVTILYVMADPDGYNFSGKVILGHFPEAVRRTFAIVQAML